MKIVVNDIAASYGGAMSILMQFYNYIRENDTENDWIFLLSDRYVEQTDRIVVECFPLVKRYRLHRILFDFSYGKRIIHSYKPDVVVSLQNTITFGIKVPQILYVQQSIPFQKIKRFSFLKRNERKCAFIQYVIGPVIRQSARCADKVVVQTKWMREAIEKTVGLPNDRLFVAFPKPEFFLPHTEKFSHNRFFYPTNNQVYKNNKTIIEACDILNRRGIFDFTVRLTLPKGTIKHRNIECIGKLPRERMQDEYNSGTLLFPSFIETVGLPLLEARLCGTMIIAADTPFARECLEGYEKSLLCPAFDAESFAVAMQNVIEEKMRLDAVSTYTDSVTGSWDVLYREIMNVQDNVSHKYSFSISSRFLQ